MEEKIKQLDVNIEGLKGDCKKKDITRKELRSKLKEIEKNFVKKECSECFKYMISSKYGQITFNHILKIVHDEINLYVKYLERQIETWRPKADLLINQIKTIIYDAIPTADVSYPPHPSI